MTNDDSEKSAHDSAIIESMQAIAAKMDEVWLIRINSPDLAPALEAFMFQILEEIRSKVQASD